MTRLTSDPRRRARGVAHRARRRGGRGSHIGRVRASRHVNGRAAKDARRRQLQSFASQQDLRPGGRDIRPLRRPGGTRTGL